MYQQYHSGLHQYALQAAPHSGAPSLMIPAPSQQTGEPHHRYPVSQQQTASLVGRPIHFTEGQFAGKTIRAKLQELQAAAFGRKYAITPGEIFTVNDLCPASDMLKWIAVR